MRRNHANADIRDAAVRKGLFLWQLAKKANVSPTTLTMWLREPLPPDDPRRILLMDVLESDQGAESNGDNGEENKEKIW